MPPTFRSPHWPQVTSSSTSFWFCSPPRSATSFFKRIGQPALIGEILAGRAGRTCRARAGRAERDARGVRRSSASSSCSSGWGSRRGSETATGGAVGDGGRPVRRCRPVRGRIRGRCRARRGTATSLFLGAASVRGDERRDHLGGAGRPRRPGRAPLGRSLARPWSTTSWRCSSWRLRPRWRRPAASIAWSLRGRGVSLAFVAFFGFGGTRFVQRSRRSWRRRGSRSLRFCRR